jgi:hypothetical protein
MGTTRGRPAFVRSTLDRTWARRMVIWRASVSISSQRRALASPHLSERQHFLTPLRFQT